MLATLFLTMAVASPLLPQDKGDAFKADFEAALAANDLDRMGRTIRKYKEVAIPIFMAKCELRALNPNKALDTWVDGFIEGWTGVYRTGFPRNFDRYIGRLDMSRRKHRDDMNKALVPLIVELQGKMASTRALSDAKRLRQDVEALVQSAYDLGDMYQLAWALNAKGNAWNPAFDREEGGNPEEAYNAYMAALDARDKLGLDNDLFYINTKKSANEMRALLGIADPETGEVPDIEYAETKILPVTKDAWFDITFEPSADAKMGALSHPSDLADDHFQAWLVAAAGAKGDAKALGALDPPVQVLRTGLNEFQLVCNGEKSELFKIGSKPELVRYPRKHDDGTMDEHALWFAVGSERDPFQEAGMNLAPSAAHVTLFYRTAASRTAKTEFGELTLYDLNGDGKFGYDTAQITGVLGAGKIADGTDRYMRQYDSMKLGKGKQTQPFTKWIANDKGKWLELEFENHGSALKARAIECAPKMGELKVVHKGVKQLKPVSMVFRSETDDTRGLYVDPMTGKGGTIEVPIGTYVFEQGLLRHSKKDGECIVLAGAEPISVTIEEGKTATVAMGGPFKLGVAVTRESGAVVVEGRTIHVVGSAGEVYVRFVDEPLIGAEVSVKGAKGGKLAKPTANDVNLKDWNYAYYPLELRVETPKSDAPVRVTVKKHPWFGALDSGWIE